MSDIHEIVRRLRDEDAAGVPAAENGNALIRRVAGASIEEIARVIVELESVRDMLRNEGVRVSREVAGLAAMLAGQSGAVLSCTNPFCGLVSCRK